MLAYPITGTVIHVRGTCSRRTDISENFINQRKKEASEVSALILNILSFVSLYIYNV